MYISGSLIVAAILALIVPFPFNILVGFLLFVFAVILAIIWDKNGISNL